MSTNTEILDGYRSLIFHVLSTEIEDFAGLRDRGVIRQDLTIDDSFWSKGSRSSKPLGIPSPSDAVELVWFFQSASLDKMADFVGTPACRIRTKLGFAPEAVIRPHEYQNKSNNLVIRADTVYAARFKQPARL